MNDLARELALEWLARAANDLRIAEFLCTMSDPPPEGIGFHAQQCAEKALKGYLTAHGRAFGRRHDLNYLLDLCVPLDPGFDQFRSDADLLTPYAVEFRYPDVRDEPSVSEALEAVAIARRLYDFVCVRVGR